jgi:hypothetical protein
MTNTTGEPPDSDTHCCATEFFRRRRRLHRVAEALGRSPMRWVHDFVEGFRRQAHPD